MDYKELTKMLKVMWETAERRSNSSKQISSKKGFWNVSKAGDFPLTN